MTLELYSKKDVELCIAARYAAEVDALWDALRKRCCATKPWTNAKRIIQLEREDLAAAMKDVRKQNEDREDCDRPRCP